MTGGINWDAERGCLPSWRLFFFDMSQEGGSYD